MRTFKFFNPQNTVVVDVETDAISSTNDNLTIHDINYVQGNADNLTSLGLDLAIKPSNRIALKTLAAALNLSLTEMYDATATALNTATSLSIATAALDAGTHGIAEVVTLTCPAFAAAAEGDFIILTTKAGVSYAIWLDKDAAGTTPTGPLFTACTHKIKVGIATGDNAIAVAGKFKADVEADTNWAGFATITDNGNGTLTITQTAKGTATNPVRKNAAESGNGNFSFTVSPEGSGDYSFQLTSAGGNGVKTYSVSSGSLPVGFTLSASGLLSGVTTAATYTVTYKVTDAFGQTATKSLALVIS